MNSNFLLLLLLAMNNNGGGQTNSCDPLSLIFCCLSFANCLGCRAADIGQNASARDKAIERRTRQTARPSLFKHTNRRG